MNHETSQGLILDYLYGEIDQAREAELKQHIAVCAECNAEVAALRRLLTLYRSAPPLAAPAAAAQKALAAARREQKHSPTRIAGGSAVSAQSAPPKARFLFHPVWGIAAVFMIVAGLLLVLPSSPDQAMKKMQEEMLRQPAGERRAEPPVAVAESEQRNIAEEKKENVTALPETKTAEGNAPALDIAHLQKAKEAVKADDEVGSEVAKPPAQLEGGKDDRAERGDDAMAEPPPAAAPAPGNVARAEQGKGDGFLGKERDNFAEEGEKALEDKGQTRGATAAGQGSAESPVARDAINEFAGRLEEERKLAVPDKAAPKPAADADKAAAGAGGSASRDLSQIEKPSRGPEGAAEGKHTPAPPAAPAAAVTKARTANELIVGGEPAPAGEVEAAQQPESKAKYAEPTPREHQGKLALTATKAEQSRGRKAEGVDAAEAAEIARLAAEAQKALQGGEWARALALYEDLLARHPAPADEAKFLAAKATCEARLQKPEFAETLKRLEALAPEQAAALRREFGKALKAGEIQRMAPARQAGRTTAPVKVKRWHPTADDYERQ